MHQHVKICEMSPRDGLQYLGGREPGEGQIVPVARRVELIRALVAAGLRHVEVASFVSARGTPQMAHSDEVARALDPAMAPGLELAGLVPNEAGYSRFRDTGLNMVAVFPSASEAYARANFHGRGAGEVLAMAASVARMARADGYAVRAHVSAAFQDIASPEAPSDLDTVVRVSRECLDAGCEWLTLADTNGTTNPLRVAEVLDAVGDALGGLDSVGVHLHDRFGTGVANVYAAWERGVRIFDSSLGGVGGSVAASIAAGEASSRPAGNVATESLVQLFHSLGASTGIDVEALMAGAGRILHGICTAAGDFAPPGGMLRERLGFGVVWKKEP